MSGFDFDEQAQVIEQEEIGAEVHIRDLFGRPMSEAVDGQEVPVTITVAGSLSRRYRQIDERFMRTKATQFPNMTGEDVQKVNLDKVVACTLAWRGFKKGGTPVDCTPQHVREAYRKFPDVYDQVWKAMHDHEVFSTTSSGTP